jgi:hypothetical protein
MRIGDNDAAINALLIKDHHKENKLWLTSNEGAYLHTANASYTLALMSAVKLAQESRLPGAEVLNINDQSLKNILGLYQSAASKGHVNAQSIISDRQRRIAITEETQDNVTVSEVEAADASWWGAHLGEAVSTVEKFRTVPTSKEVGSIALSTHVGHPLRSQRPVFVTGPSCHFSVATIDIRYTLHHASRFHSNEEMDVMSNQSKHFDNGNKSASVHLDLCNLHRLDGCASNILKSDEILELVTSECEQFVSKKQQLLDSEITNSNATSVTKDETFRVYLDHRLNFDINVEEGTLQQTLKVGRMDDPWAIAAVVCQIFSTTADIIDDDIPGDCERQVGYGIDEFLTNQRHSLFIDLGLRKDASAKLNFNKDSLSAGFPLQHRVVQVVSKLLCEILFHSLATPEYFAVHQTELCKEIDASVSFHPLGLHHHDATQQLSDIPRAFESWNKIEAKLGVTEVLLEFARSSSVSNTSNENDGKVNESNVRGTNTIKVQLDLLDPIGNVMDRTAEWWPVQNVGTDVVTSMQCKERNLSLQECEFVVKTLWNERVRVAEQLFSSFRFASFKNLNSSVTLQMLTVDELRQQFARQ